MNNFEKIKQKHNHFGEMCCWFSNGHKCTRPCVERCGAYEDIDYYEDIEDEIFDKEAHIKCPKCGWHFACKNTETGLVMCAFCQYRSKKNENRT